MDEEDGGLSMASYYNLKKLPPTEFEVKLMADLDNATSYSVYEKPTVPLKKEERLRRLNARAELKEDYKKVREGKLMIYNKTLRNGLHMKLLEKLEREKPRLQGKNYKVLGIWSKSYMTKCFFDF